MPLLAYSAIDDELEMCMGVWLYRQWVRWPFFLSFMESITITSAHNMLDPRFKGLKCVIDFLGHDKAKLLIEEYDNKFLIPLLVKCSYFLNLDIVSTYTSIVDSSLFNFKCKGR